MGLDMKTRKASAGESLSVIKKQVKKARQILQEYTATLGYNRDYLANLLTNRGKTGYAVLEGKPPPKWPQKA
jgi:hypothetical protein